MTSAWSCRPNNSPNYADTTEYTHVSGIHSGPETQRQEADLASRADHRCDRHDLRQRTEREARLMASRHPEGDGAERRYDQWESAYMRSRKAIALPGASAVGTAKRRGCQAEANVGMCPRPRWRREKWPSGNSAV